MKSITITKTSTAKAIGHRSNGNCKPVYCITTGKVYDSALSAAEELGVSSSVLSMAAAGKLKTCKGERYCYVSQVMNYLEEIAECSRVRAEKVAAYDKIVGKQQKINALAERKAKLAKMKEKLEREAAAIAAEEAELGEV